MKTIMMKTVGVLLILLMLFSVLMGCVNSGGNTNEPGDNEGACSNSNYTLFPEGYTCGFPDLIPSSEGGLKFGGLKHTKNAF